MGNQNIKTSQYFFQKYQLINQIEEKNLSIWHQKKTDNQFIVKQSIFTIKQQFDRKLIQFNNLQQVEQCENILKLRKVWSQQHNGFCSSTYKIYCMYEYSSITLQQQIQARKLQKRHFEEEQLLGIIQTCLNSLNTQNALLFCPQEVYVSNDGLLKIINSDLYDFQKFNNFHPCTYYSPEKIQNFACNMPNQQQLIKQSIFSLGMTMIHCITLEKQFSIYNPLQTVKTKRFSKVLLHNLINSLYKKNKINKRLLNLIQQMLSYQKNNRPLIRTIQEQLNQISAENSINQQQQNQQNEQRQNQQNILQAQTIIIQQQRKQSSQKGQVYKNSIFKDENISNIFYTNLKINKFTDNSQLQILKQISSNNNNNAINSNNSKNLRQNQKLIQILEDTFILTQFPNPISQQNSLFTNPQFIKKIKEDLNSQKQNRSFQYLLSTKQNPILKSVQNHAQFGYFPAHRMTESKSLSIFHEVELNIQQKK